MRFLLGTSLLTAGLVLALLNLEPWRAVAASWVALGAGFLFLMVKDWPKAKAWGEKYKDTPAADRPPMELGRRAKVLGWVVFLLSFAAACVVLWYGWTVAP